MPSSGTAITSRIPLNTLAIPLGLAGLADVWADSMSALRLPSLIGQVFWLLTAVAWVWMITAHLLRGRLVRGRPGATLAEQLKHPVQGPLASLVPIVGMLLAVDLHRFWRVGGLILGIVSIAGAALFAAWLVSSWTAGRLELESMHGGYFLPTVAAGYIAAATAAELGSRSIAVGAFVIASFFWVALFTLLIARLAFRPPLPPPLVPTLTILMAPPAVAAHAWFVIAGDRINPVQQALAALAVFMVLVQVGLLRRYLRLTFSLGFWSFTFPTAAVADLGVSWLQLERPDGRAAVVVALLVGVSALVAGIGIRSLRIWIGGRAARAEAQLSAADNRITPRNQEA